RASSELGPAARPSAGPTLNRVLTGLAALFTVWASGLVLLAAESFPQQTIRWETGRLNAIAVSALWFLLAPFIFPISSVVISGGVVTALVLGWCAVVYLRLARDSRY